MYSPETQARLNALRAKAATGATLSLEEVREGILLLRAGRLAAAASSAKARASRPTRKSGDDLLSELDGL